MTEDHERLEAAVASRQWYHTIDLGHGVITPGWFDTRSVAAKLPIPDDLSGKRVLDCGTFDGFWAFEMERRGASEVVAIDVPDPEDWDWPATVSTESRRAISKRHEGGHGFEIVHDALGSKVRRERMNVYDLSPDELGMFDRVHLGSLLLHLRDPVRALESVRSVCSGQVLVVDAIDPNLTLKHPRAAVARFDGLGRPWWWKPNQAALVRMVKSAGFSLTRPPQRVWMKPGLGQQRPKLSPRTLRSYAGRTAALLAYVGDPHVAIEAEPDNVPRS